MATVDRGLERRAARNAKEAGRRVKGEDNGKERAIGPANAWPSYTMRQDGSVPSFVRRTSKNVTTAAADFSKDKPLGGDNHASFRLRCYQHARHASPTPSMGFYNTTVTCYQANQVAREG